MTWYALFNEDYADNREERSLFLEVMRELIEVTENRRYRLLLRNTVY